MFIQNWHEKLSESDRCQTYISFKLNFGKEKYIDDISINRFRQAFARLCLGANALAINNQYIQEVPETNCKVCYVPETEIHFILHCPLYVDVRRKHLSVFGKLKDIRSINALLGNPDKDKVRALATYIYHASKRRQERMP